MNALTKKIETQVQFWSLLGPSLLLLSITVLIFKVSPHWYFPISALVGIPLCAKWKTKGLTAALGFLLLFSAFSFGNLELNDRYWHVGLSLAMAFSFIIFTLSVEEAQGLIHKVQVESQSRLDNLLLLDEKWKLAELQWAQEKEKTLSEVALLEQEIAKVKEEKQAFYKIAALANEEAGQVRAQQSFLLQDLLYKKQHIAQLNERLEECELTIQDFVNSNAEKIIAELKAKVEETDLEKETLQAKVERFRLEGLSLSQEIEKLQGEIEKFREDLHAEQTNRSFSQDALHRLQALLLEERKEAEERLKTKEVELEQERGKSWKSQELLAQLESEKQQLQELLETKNSEERQRAEREQKAAATAREVGASVHLHHQPIFSLYAQLKVQFQEKSDVLDATRKELFALQEALLKMQKEREEERLYAESEAEKEWEKQFRSLNQQFEEMKKMYEQEIEELNQVIRALLEASTA